MEGNVLYNPRVFIWLIMPVLSDADVFLNLKCCKKAAAGVRSACRGFKRDASSGMWFCWVLMGLTRKVSELQKVSGCGSVVELWCQQECRTHAEILSGIWWLWVFSCFFYFPSTWRDSKMLQPEENCCEGLRDEFDWVFDLTDRIKHVFVFFSKKLFMSCVVVDSAVLLKLHVWLDKPPYFSGQSGFPKKSNSEGLSCC